MRRSIVLVVLVLAVLVPFVLAADSSAGTRATVNAESAAVYAETSSTSTLVRKLAKGEVLNVAYSVVTSDGEWCSLDGASRGYVQCRYLTREESPKREAGPAPLPTVLTPAVTAAARLQPRSVAAQPPSEPVVFTPEQSALIGAAKMGNVNAMQLALGKGAVLNGRDKDGKTALMWAAYMGRNEAVTELLSAGAEVNLADNLGWTALEGAVWSRRPAAVDLLLERGAEVNARDSEGRTPLMHAAQYGDLVMMRALLAKGADPNARNRFDQTPLMFAVTLYETAAAELLLSAGADVNAKDAAGRSVLINAAIGGAERSTIVHLLVEHAADLNAKDNDGRTALAWALKKGHTSIAQMLKKAGAAEW
jgi:ankyrin repeat protein